MNDVQFSKELAVASQRYPNLCKNFEVHTNPIFKISDAGFLLYTVQHICVCKIPTAAQRVGSVGQSESFQREREVSRNVRALIFVLQNF